MLGLINLNPAVDVALLGAALAVLPAAWVLRQGRKQGLRGWPAWQRVLTVATLFLTLDLVVFGAFTRLTDSGLGCPDWPGCYGELSPFQAHGHISAAQAVAPDGPVTHGKAWIEMVHRYLATAVGALITGLMLMAWRMRRAGGLSPWWATATFVWVCAQGAFGALTVTLKLQPIIVTGHLLGAVLGVALLAAQVRVLSPRQALLDGGWAVSGLRRLGMAVLALLVLQIASGAWVSTNYAVLACTEFPTCQGQWWPAMNWAGFALWRELGKLAWNEDVRAPCIDAECARLSGLDDEIGRHGRKDSLDERRDAKQRVERAQGDRADPVADAREEVRHSRRAPV